MKNKVFIIAVIVIVIVLLGAVFYFHRLPAKHDDDVLMPVMGKKILFYGKECPHCKILEKYLIKNKIAVKVPFVQKEVLHNRQNLNELIMIAKYCKIATDYIEVPFLWTGEKCLIGNEDIEKFFKRKLNEK